MTDYVHRVSDEERERIRRFLRVSAIVTVGIVVLVIVAVLTARHWVTVISPESERKFVQPYISWLQSYVIDGAEPVLQNYVDRLGRDIAADMELPDGMELEFHVVEGSTINAFTTLGGYIFVSSSSTSSRGRRSMRSRRWAVTSSCSTASCGNSTTRTAWQWCSLTRSRTPPSGTR
jgi:hypothetical protein